MIKESVVLPSLGIPYNLGRTTISVRPLTTRAYKDFIVTASDEGVQNLVDSCLVDCPLKSEELVYQDLLAVYIKIRTISIGTKIPVYSNCPHCSSKNKDEWDLMKLECSYLNIDKYPFPITLPESKEQIYLSIPTSLSQKIAKEEAQKRATQFNKKLSDFLPSFQVASLINTSEDLVGRVDWYTNLPLKDAIFIDQALDQLQDFGVHTIRLIECPECKKEYSMPLQINTDFFRPSIGSIEGIKISKGTLEKGPSDPDETKQDS